MIKSLKAQIYIVLIVLVVSLLVQILLSRSVQSTLVQNQKNIEQSHTLVEMVQELERDVIDLQRNVLIYKETTSDASVSRFYELMGRVEQGLSNFEVHTYKELTVGLEDGLIERMKGHLSDYKVNFIDVVNGRSKRKSYEDKLTKNYQLLNDWAYQKEATSKIKLTERDISQIRYQMALSEKYINQYLVSPDYRFVTSHNRSNLVISKIVDKYKNNASDIDLLLKTIKKDFIRLTQITRGYLFLVNVVMAGSANEFLYSTKKLRETVTENQLRMSDLANVIADKNRVKTDVVSLLTIFIVLLTAWVLSRKIIQPVRNITDVFKRLVVGEEVESIPGEERKDEIGDLARAANVFHSKNQQTSELLNSAQEMNIYQEELNKQLLEQKKKAEQAAESKSMFLANMSHEIRTPMNGIIGLIDLALKTSLTRQQEEYLRKASFSGQIMLNVINDILDFSKIEAGKMHIESTEFNVNDIVEGLISSMLSNLQEKHLEFRVHSTSAVPEKLLGDPLRISQVLLNICNNAIKFTEAGMIQVGFDYKLDKNSAYLLVEIRDTGIGMDDKQVAQIFNSFTQADGSTSRKYGGTGLGLTIVKQLADLMGGEVHVESRQGKGSCFKISIQADRVSDDLLLRNFSKIDRRLCYFASSEPLLDASVYESMHITAEKNNQNMLEAMLNSFDENTICVFDVEGDDCLTGHDDFLKQLIKNKVAVGFVTRSRLDVLPVNLLDKWQCPVLSHPYSPRELITFFSSLYKTTDSDKADSDISETDDVYFKGHVLLVEDNHVNQLVAGQMIKNLGMTVDVVDNGEKAVEKINQGIHYDLVLMDVQMPVMDGYTATREIRNNGYNQLVICGLSANALKEDIELAEAAGMNDYLTKPLETDHLIQMCHKYLPTAEVL